MPSPRKILLFLPALVYIVFATIWYNARELWDAL
jgi:hypothetical protein